MAPMQGIRGCYSSAMRERVSGWRCTNFRRVTACPFGALRPCSQFSKVRDEVCNRRANTPRDIRSYHFIYVPDLTISLGLRQPSEYQYETDPTKYHKKVLQ